MAQRKLTRAETEAHMGYSGNHSIRETMVREEMRAIEAKRLAGKPISPEMFKGESGRKALSRLLAIDRARALSPRKKGMK